LKIHNVIDDKLCRNSLTYISQIGVNPTTI